MKYFYYHWNESRGDQFDHWGTSDWYFEIGQDGYVSRSIHIYASSNALFYSEQHIEDVYGVLPEGKFELIGEEKEISKSEFECVIDSTKFTNVASTI